jgi:hypothetical protein
MTSASPLALQVMVRMGCHLCEELLELLARHPRAEHFLVEALDVDSRADWQAKYGPRVPVVLAGEAEICEYFLDFERLEQVLDGVFAQS